MITRKSAILVLALLVLQFLGPLLHAHIAEPTAPTQAGMHLHADEIPEFANSARLETTGYLLIHEHQILIHEHQIKTVALQQALNAQNELVMPDWQLLLPVLLLLLPLLLQRVTGKASTPRILPRPQRSPAPHAPRAPPLA